MAKTNVTPAAVELNGISAALAFGNGNTTDGNAVSFKGQDTKTVIVFNASAAGSATVKAGTMIQGVKDIVLTVPEGISCAVVDSGYFLNDDQEVVIVPSAATVKVAAVVLP